MKNLQRSFALASSWWKLFLSGYVCAQLSYRWDRPDDVFESHPLQEGFQTVHACAQRRRIAERAAHRENYSNDPTFLHIPALCEQAKSNCRALTHNFLQQASSVINVNGRRYVQLVLEIQRHRIALPFKLMYTPTLFEVLIFFIHCLSFMKQWRRRIWGWFSPGRLEIWSVAMGSWWPKRGCSCLIEPEQMGLWCQFCRTCGTIGKRWILHSFQAIEMLLSTKVADHFIVKWLATHWKQGSGRPCVHPLRSEWWGYAFRYVQFV